jgi:hypothetical protein
MADEPAPPPPERPSDGGAGFCAVSGAVLLVCGLVLLVYGAVSKPVSWPFIAAGTVGLLAGIGLLSNAVELDRRAGS